MTEKPEVVRTSEGNSIAKENLMQFGVSDKQQPFYLAKKLSFKPIQEQIKEERFKRPVQVKKQSQIDGNLMLALNNHEGAFNDGDFDYFQYFGQKKTEEAKWKQLQEDDINNFKKSRSELVIKEAEKKQQGVYVLKETKEEESFHSKAKPKVKIGIKIKKSASETSKTPSENGESKSQKSGENNTKGGDNNTKTGEDSDDYDLGILSIKKVKKE